MSQYNSSAAENDWTAFNITCEYERFGGRALASTSNEHGFQAFSNGFWVTDGGRYSASKSDEFISPKRIIRIFRNKKINLKVKKWKKDGQLSTDIDIREQKNLEELSALSGRVLATLDQAQLELLFAFYQQGRKVGVSVNLDSEEPEEGDLSTQLRSVVAGDYATPIWRKNTIITINTQIK